MTSPIPDPSGTGVPEAARVLDQGGLVVYPTDTLYGLGARVDRPEAVRRVFAAKRRPWDQPLSVAVADPAMIEHVAEVTPLARSLFRFLPGPLTLVLQKRPAIPDLVTGGAPTVGVRVPDHPVCLDLLRRAGPLTATSANVHGQADPRTIDDARRSLGDRVNYYLASSSPPSGVASTLVDARGRRPRILRTGALRESEIRESQRD